jgi:proline racemase
VEVPGINVDVLESIEVHCGEPCRVIVDGVPPIPGGSVFEKMVYLRDNADHIRKLMLREPRGYPAMCCNLIVAPTHPDADIGLIIMEQSEYPPMSGGNLICVITALVESRAVEVVEPVTDLVVETPAGLVSVSCRVVDGKAIGVEFENVPSFVVHLDKPLEITGVGTVPVSVAWGGMFYAIVDADALGIDLAPDQGRSIAELGVKVRQAAREQLPAVHPMNEEIAGVTITLFSGSSRRHDATAKNAVVMSAGEFDWDNPSSWVGVLDRSVCGTGTAAVMAVRHAKGLLDLGAEFRHEGILGTVFTGRIVRTTAIGGFDAIVPRISGQAWITGFTKHIVRPTDPFPEGFMLGDIWGPSWR